VISLDRYVGLGWVGKNPRFQITFLILQALKTHDIDIAILSTTLKQIEGKRGILDKGYFKGHFLAFST